MERRMGGDVESSGESSPFLAFAWGLLSASSLVLGAAIGIARLPSKVVRASMMAFGGGALIEALSIELFAHIIATARGGHRRRLSGGEAEHHHVEEAGGHEEGHVDRGLVFLALGAALAGGLLFAGLDTVISGHGAFLRKASTVHAYVNRLRSALLRRLVERLKRVPMFEVLDVSELERLARSVVRERYLPGATIFQELSRDSSIYFVLSGCVDLTVTTHYHKAWGATSSADFAWSTKSAEMERAKEEVHLKRDEGLGPTGIHVELSENHNQRDSVEEVKDRFRLGPNDIFGEMALFTGDSVDAKAVAHTRTSVLRIPRAAIHKLLASNRRLQDFVAMTAIDRLRETEVFCRCTPSTVARLVSFMKQAEYEEGDVLYHDVDAFCPIYFVVLGCVEVERATDDGVERHMVHANGLLGTDHLVMGSAVHAVATAMERTTVLIVQRSDIDKLCEKDKRFQQALMSSHASLPPVPCVTKPSTALVDNRVQRQRRGPGCVQQSCVHPSWQLFSGCLGLPGKNLKVPPPESFLQPTVAVGDARTPTVELDPPEGAVGPSRFGFSFLEELGWHKKDPDSSSEEMKDRAVSEPFSLDEVSERERQLEEEDEGNLLGGNRVLLGADADLPDLLANEDATAEQEGKEGHHGHEARGAQAAIMIWLGILIDGVPESFVMGILVNTATQGQLLAFVVGVFLANFPEAMSSAGTMRLCGMRKRVIMMMWSSITILTGVGAGLGAVIFPPGSTDDPTVMRVIAGIEGLCGGAMLCMIANTVLPEAFEQGGNVTGLSTLLGFIVAVSVSVAS